MAAADHDFPPDEPDGPSVPGAADDVDVALLQLCRQLTAVTLRAGARQRPALPLSHIRVLTALAAARGTLSLGHLTTRLGQTPTTMSSLCSQLVQSGLAERSVGPGIEVGLSLSAAGAELLASVNRHRLHQLRGLLDALPPADRTVVLQALTRLAGQHVERDELW
jgi:DNA-binding MarR family transcriptional regulator